MFHRDKEEAIKTPKIPNPGKEAAKGIAADTELAPFQYLINSAATLGNKITINGHTYDFTGLGQSDTAGKISDQMAQALLDLQKEKSPEIIAQRLAELKAADPEGYAARQQLFDRIMADAQNNPSRPVSTDLQQQLQDELAKGVGFSDAKQEQQVREGVRGKQVRSGVYLGAAPTSEEAKSVLSAGEALRNERQQNALNLLESGASPEDVAYRQFEQTISNLGAFQRGETPQAQFKQVSSAGQGPVSLVGGATPTNTFDPNAAGQGINNAFDIYGIQQRYNQGQANPWLAGLSIGAQGAGAMAQTNPSWFRTSPTANNGVYPGFSGTMGPTG